MPRAGRGFPLGPLVVQAGSIPVTATTAVFMASGSGLAGGATHPQSTDANMASASVLTAAPVVVGAGDPGPTPTGFEYIRFRDVWVNKSPNNPLSAELMDHLEDAHEAAAEAIALLQDEVVEALKHLAVRATLNVSSAPTVGDLQPYDASAGPLAPPLPPLTDALVTAGATIVVEKDPADLSSNPVTVTCAAGDFFRGGATTVALLMPGERVEVQATSLGGARAWKVIRQHAPRSSYDARYAFGDVSPTLEELQRSVTLPASIAATSTCALGATNMGERVGALTLAFSGTVGVSDTNYWTISLVRYRAAGTPVVLAKQTTRAADGKAITPYAGWDLDNVAWPASLRYLRKGDGLALVLTPTGTPPALTAGVAMLRYEPNVTPPVADSFSRNDANILGLADTGQAWSQNAGVWGVRSQAAVIHTKAGDVGGTRDYAMLDTGYPSGSVSATLLVAASAGIGVRGQKNGDGTTSGYIHSANQYLRVDASVVTLLATLSETFVDGDVATITVSGTTHSIYRNGNQVGQVVDGTYPSSRRLILRASSGAVADVPIIDDLVFSP